MNIWDIIIVLLIAAALGAAVCRIRKMRRQGGCGCGCAGCRQDCEKRR